MPTVTTIIPAYNAADTVERAVASALEQRGVDVEVIVVDDGSTDGTWEKLSHLGPHVTRVRQANGGPAKARNYGARLAKGEWLAFLDADDEWLPGKLSGQLALADAEGGLIYTDRLNFGAVERIATRQSDGVALGRGDVFEALLFDNFITTSSVAIRKEVFTRLGGFDEGGGLVGVEDWDLWLRYAAAAPVRLCPEALVRYRWHPAGLSNRFEHLSRARLEVLNRALASSRGRRVSRRVARQAVARAWQCSAWFVAPVDRRKALAWYCRSAIQWPWDRGVYKGIVKCCLGRN